MFLMRADTLRGQVGGGWVLEECFGPKMALDAISRNPLKISYIAAKMIIYLGKFEFTLCMKDTKHIFIHQFYPILQLDEHYSHSNSTHAL
jgi:hypothetical protein